VDLGSDTSTGPVCAASTPARMPWLQGRWSVSKEYDDDPMSRASFGIYRGGPVIYMREVY
jgi:MSHA biogenesis protein MshQ